MRDPGLSVDSFGLIVLITSNKDSGRSLSITGRCRGRSLDPFERQTLRDLAWTGEIQIMHLDML